MKRWHNFYFELGSQPSPPFKAHPLSFEQGSLHTGGLVAYRSLSIPGHCWMDYVLSGQIARNIYIVDHAILQERITLMMRNDTKAIIHIDAGNLENSQSSVICISIFQEIVVDWIQNLKIALFE